MCQMRSRKRSGACSAMPAGGSSTWPSASTMRAAFCDMGVSSSLRRSARGAARVVGGEQLRQGGLQELALALQGGRAARILLRHRLEQGRAREVAENEQVEGGGEMGQVGGLPRAAALREHVHALLVERPQQPGYRARQVAPVLQRRALDQPREMRMVG